MPDETRTTKPSARERFAHEMREFETVFLFIAPFCLSFEAYRMYWEGKTRPVLGLGLALLNAMVLSKIVLIGEMAHLGESSRNKPLLVITVHKAAVFAVFYSLFHLLERGVHGLLHGESFQNALRAEFTHGGGLAIRTFVVFFAFIPFFALRESRQIIGEERFTRLFLGSGRDWAPRGGGGARLQPRPHG